MQITNERETDCEQRLKDIGELIRIAFGRGFKPNRHIVHGPIDSLRIFDESHLDQIVKKHFLLGVRYAGKFKSQDGSQLEVEEPYLAAAQKYAKLYKKRFEKEVSVTVISRGASRYEFS